MTNTKAMGAWGENLAKKYLLGKDYSFVAANYRINRREFDLICQKNNTLVFIEVKTKRETPASSLDNPLSTSQLRGLKQAIIAYANKNRVSLDAVRLDLIVILADQKQTQVKLKHYKDIF